MLTPTLGVAVRLRPCTPADEPSWLRCRALSFLDSQYYDDVRTAHPLPAEGSAEAGQLISWVAVAAADPRPETAAEAVVGILDVELGAIGTDEESLATIDTVGVHPDWRGRGIATELLEHVCARLPERISTLDAWTREDPAARAWYRDRGFTLDQEYLHVYQSWDETTPGLTPPQGLSAPVTAFFHADLADEDRWRATYRRVHRCGRFLRRIR